MYGYFGSELVLLFYHLTLSRSKYVTLKRRSDSQQSEGQGKGKNLNLGLWRCSGRLAPS